MYFSFGTEVVLFAFASRPPHPTSGEGTRWKKKMGDLLSAFTSFSFPVGLKVLVHVCAPFSSCTVCKQGSACNCTIFPIKQASCTPGPASTLLTHENSATLFLKDATLFVQHSMLDYVYTRAATDEPVGDPCDANHASDDAGDDAGDAGDGAGDGSGGGSLHADAAIGESSDEFPAGKDGLEYTYDAGEDLFYGIITMAVILSAMALFFCIVWNSVIIMCRGDTVLEREDQTGRSENSTNSSKRVRPKVGNQCRTEAPFKQRPQRKQEGLQKQQKQQKQQQHRPRHSPQRRQHHPVHARSASDPAIPTITAPRAIYFTPPEFDAQDAKCAVPDGDDASWKRVVYRKSSTC